MTDEDLARYQNIIKEKDDRIASLEAALRDVTCVDGSSVHVAYHEFVDLTDYHPILREVHGLPNAKKKPAALIKERRA